ncbi:MAG: hypothetical protein J6T70_03020 [Bacteroidales bacterium]|nr:hypothetical protein [Bacteroidales bacterium]
MERLFLLPIAAAMSAMIFLPSCNKDDNEVKISHKDSANVIEVLTKSQYAVGGNFSPSNGAKDIYVGTDFSIKPGVALNTPFEVKLADQTVTYRYDLKACTITDASGADFATGFNYSEQDTLITINSKILNGNTEYTLSSTIALMQQINGEWQPVVYNGDAKEYVSTSLFTTCQAADTLRPADILFSYPIDRQLNYMPKEYQEGYIMLSYKYPELFNGASANDMKVIIKNITDDTKAEQSTPFTVKESHEVEGEAVELGYSLKDIMFDPNQIYSLAFYCGEKQVHQIYFRTSFYETLKSKLAAHEGNFDGELHYDGLSDNYLCASFKVEEYFDKFECQTLDNFIYEKYGELPRSETLNTCLIPIEFDFDNCDWYQTSIFKYIYDKIPTPTNDQRGNVKYPPINACELFQVHITKVFLSDEEIQTKIINSWPNIYRLRIYMSYYFIQDGKNSQSHIFNNGAESETEEQIMKINVKDWFLLANPIGTYSYDLSFRLPGKNIITYQERHMFTYNK